MPAAYTVTAEDGSTADYTVVVSLEPLSGVSDVGHYLTTAGSIYAGTETAPIPLPVNITLSSDWADLLSAIQTGGKYAALDLSACTGVTEFDPGTANTGESKIVSLVLPDGATSVKADTTYGSKEL